MRNYLLGKHRRAVSLAVVLLVFACSGTAAGAQSTGGFSVSAVIPDNQIDKRQSYFDLRMQPSDEQTLELVITNSYDKELTAELRLNAASTARNGLIVYNIPDVRDEHMELSVSDVAKLRTDSVTVPAHGSKKIYVDVKMPDEPYDGVLLGGIAVTGSLAESDSKNSNGVAVKNRITYVVALVLTENDIEVAPDFELTSITPGLVNYKTAVTVRLRNNAARIAKGMSVTAQVYRMGSGSVLYEFTGNNAEMAPLSSGDFVIDWQNKPLSRGTYRLRVTVDYEGRHWEWDEELIIGSEANDINKGAIGLVKDRTWLYASAGGALFVLLLFIAYDRGRRTRKRAS